MTKRKRPKAIQGVRVAVRESWQRLRTLDPDSDAFDVEASTLLMIMSDEEFLVFMRDLCGELVARRVNR
jgi:hypothetical protein